MGVADAQASAQNAYAVIHHAEVVPSFAMPSTLALGPMAWSAVGRGAGLHEVWTRRVLPA